MLTLNIDRIFYFFGANTELVNLTKLYFASIKFAIPICVFDSILSAYLRNDNNPELAFWAVIVGGIFNAILDYYFVFILDMGIFGAGLATAIGLTICTTTMLLHLITRKCTLKLVMPSNMYHKIKEVIILGFPAIHVTAIHANLTPIHIGDITSEVRILGTESEQGVVLLMPSEKVKNGDRVF